MTAVKLPHRDADQLVLGPRWIGQGAEKIEHGADANFATRADGVPHCAVQRRGKQKAHAHLMDRRLYPGRLQANVEAQGLQQIGAAAYARGRPIAVLGHHHPRQPPQTPPWSRC